ncbi:MAG: AMP-binding protein, partial [Bacteroidota bacterium]
MINFDVQNNHAPDCMLPLEKLTLRALLQSRAIAFADRPALSAVDGEQFTYASFNHLVQTVSDLLHNRGVITGDKVAILSENKPQWGIAYFAITVMGAVAVPILADFHTSEVHHIIQHSECKAVFVSKRLYGKIENLGVRPLPTIIILDDFTLVPPRTTKDKLTEVLDEGGREFARLKERALKFVGLISATVEEDDLAAIV